jgi:UDP-N-acetylmuramate dehydrogenase
MQQVVSELQAARIGDILLNEPLASHTYWKIGGPADVLAIPRGKKELIETVRIAGRHGVPVFPLGRGSNLLVTDKGIRGITVKLGKELDYVQFDDHWVRAGGGFSLIKLSAVVSKKGLSGLEFAGGIPASVGGAVFMNAGAHGSDVSRILHQAEVLFLDGELAVLKNEDMRYAYRHSILHERPGIVIEAVFRLKPGDPQQITEARNAFREKRLRTQPLQLASCGSVFRNPENHFAARLIEEAGMKGRRVGGAEVSPLHANFIINTGKATAADVITLMNEVQETVFRKFGIRLIPEVMVVGER